VNDVPASFSQLKAGVLTIGTDAFFNGQTERLARMRYAVPTIYQYHEFAESGGLMSHGAVSKTVIFWPVFAPAEFSRASG
jgi:hypothetical protein